MQLSQIQDGASCQIREVNGKGAIRQRLIDMGLLPDVELKVERRAPGGDPIWVSLGSWQMALRLKEADSIIVSALLHRT